MKRILILAVLILAFGALGASAQERRTNETEIKIVLNEQFFDSLLSAVFQNIGSPSIAIKGNGNGCEQLINIREKMDGVKTAVKFQNGKIIAPIAFDGRYSLPLVGCVPFSGWAQTRVDLSLDRQTQTIVGKATAQSVNLSGSRGIGGDLLARFAQSSLDKKVNPIKIIELNKLSFNLPIRDSGNLLMRAIGFSYKIKGRDIVLTVRYRFEKP